MANQPQIYRRRSVVSKLRNDEPDMSIDTFQMSLSDYHSCLTHTCVYSAAFKQLCYVLVNSDAR